MHRSCTPFNSGVYFVLDDISCIEIAHVPFDSGVYFLCLPKKASVSLYKGLRYTRIQYTHIYIYIYIYIERIYI